MIFLSAGHHKKDPGAVANGFKEADLTMELRDLIVAELEDRGQKRGINFITDKDEETLGQYLSRIKPGTASVVFELHFDAAAAPAATGTTMLIPDRQWTKEHLLEVQFGTEVVSTTSKIIGIKDRGVWPENQSARKRLAIMREPGINGLLEVCFITNAEDLHKYKQAKKILAFALADILIRYDALK